MPASEFRTSSHLLQSPLPLWVVRRDSLAFLEVSAETLRRLGLEPAEVQGRSLEELPGFGPLGRRLRELDRESGAPGPHALGLWRIPAAGGSFPAEVRVRAVDMAGQAGWLGVFLEAPGPTLAWEALRARQEADHLMARVAATANRAATAEEAFRAALTALCGHGGWALAHAHLAEDAGGRPLHLWCGPLAAESRLFRSRVESAQFAPGYGPFGRVWSEGKPAWTASLQDDPAFLHPGRSGALRCAAAFPVTLGSEVQAVVELYGDRPLQPSMELWELLDRVAPQLAHAMERDAAARALKESEARFRDLFESIPDGVVVHEHGRILDVNPAYARLFGCSREGMAGRSVQEFVAPESRAELGRRIAAGFQGAHQAMGLRGDGTSFPFEAHERAHRHRGRTVRLAVVRDVTHRREQEEALVHAHKLEGLGVLAGGIAHHFNNLLTSILGHLDLAVDMLPAAEPTRALLQEATRSALRAGDLCRQMMACAGKGEMSAGALGLNELVEELAAPLRASLPPGQGLELELEADLPCLEGDRDQLRRGLLNLVMNARDALEDRPGGIRLRTGRAGQGSVWVEVRDTGPGMPPEVARRIFDPFFSTKCPGRGLGLAEVAGIVKAHRGRVEVEHGPGGTAFRMTFPAAGPAQAEVPETPLQDWRGRGRVLVVEDEPANRDFLALALKRLGFEPELAADGLEGAARFEADPGAYDLVLLDLVMPRLDGEGALRRMRERRPDLPVVLMSGFSEAEVEGRFRGLDVAGFLSKPFTFSELRRRLQGLVATALPALRA